MVFLCDVIITVSFKVSFPHLKVFEVWQSWTRLCHERQYKFSSVCMCCLKYTFSSSENDFGDTFLKTFIYVSSIL